MSVIFEVILKCTATVDFCYGMPNIIANIYVYVVINN